MLLVSWVVFLPGGLLIAEKIVYDIYVQSSFDYFSLRFYLLLVAVKILVGQNRNYTGFDNNPSELRIFFWLLIFRFQPVLSMRDAALF